MTRHRLRSACRMSLLALTLCLTLSVPGHARVCERVQQLGATLLFPYFEVDPADPAGRTTLIAINNAEGEPVLAHVVLWTNLGIPTLAFDLYLHPHEVQTVNLAHIFRDMGGKAVGKPVMSALGRYSVSFNAVAVDGACNVRASKAPDPDPPAEPPPEDGTEEDY